MVMDDAHALKQQLNAAYSGAAPHSIQGLYTFQAAATILRIAFSLGELDASVVDISVDADESTSSTSPREEALSSFLKRLDIVEKNLTSSSPCQPTTTIPSYAIHHHGQTSTVKFKSHVIVVEGLDGSGKSSLVSSLAEHLNTCNGSTCNKDTQAVAWATPTASMNPVRPVFDKRGGPVARAFYMVSNYLLQYEIQQLEEELRKQLQQEDEKSDSKSQTTKLFVVVDRWYTSTVAYSCAWKNTSGGVESIDALQVQDPSIFAWPTDLRPPDILFLLQVDDHVRRNRVQSRRQQSKELSSSASNCSNKDQFNPWDQRLDDDAQLGHRIMRAFERVAEQLATSNNNNHSKAATRVIRLNANQPKECVVADALEHIHDHVSTTVFPVNNPLAEFRHQPLQWFQWVSSELGLCDRQTGRRRKHAPWALQVAWNATAKQNSDGNSDQYDFQSPPPVLKTVGIHSSNESGILFFMRRDPSLNNTNATIPASVVWVGGDYPYEQQWRGEGIMVPVSWSECELLETLPPPSLVAQTAACTEYDKHEEGRTSYLLGEDQREQVQDRAQNLRENLPPDSQQKNLLQGFRFVPLRMEVLAGGPSSPGGPLRYEWMRGLHNNDNNDKMKDASSRFDTVSGWTQASPILPFRSAPQLPVPIRALKPYTVAITGTHCSGKTTLGRRLATLLGATFHAELGDVLRDSDHLVAGGHRTGDGSGDGAASWDDRVFDAEVSRDKAPLSENGCACRIVETWHVGNLEWALLRLHSATATATAASSGDNDEVNKEKDRLVTQTKHAIENELTRRCVIAVHLTIRPEDSLRRRQIEPSSTCNAKLRIPMASETKEVGELHQFLDVSAQDHLQLFQNDLPFPSLVVDNSNDENLQATIQQILQFIQEQHWRRAF